MAEAASAPATLRRRLLALAAGLALFSVGMSVLLVAFKLDNTLRELRHGRFSLVAGDVARVVEHSLSLGMDLADLGALDALLQRRGRADDEILSIDVADAAGRVLYSSAAERRARAMPAAWRAALRRPPSGAGTAAAAAGWRWRGSAADADDAAVAGAFVDNSFAVPQGYVAVRYASGREGQARRDLAAALWPAALAVLGAAAAALCLLATWLARRFERELARAVAGVDGKLPAAGGDGWAALVGPALRQLDGAEAALAAWRAGAPAAPPAGAPAPMHDDAEALPGRRLGRLGMAAMLLIAAAAMAALCGYALLRAEGALLDEAAGKAEAVALSLAGTFERAALLGIPLARITGVAAALDEVRARNGELAGLAVLAGGATLYQSGDAGAARPALSRSVPLASADGAGARLQVALDPGVVEQLFAELALDFAVILLVALFLMLELADALTGALLLRPLRTLCRDARALGAGRLGVAVAADHPGAMGALALALQRRQARVLADYRACRRRLADQLAARHGTDADAPARAALAALRRLRDRFGLVHGAPRALPPERAGALGSMRAPFFLLLLAEDLSRGFLPIYAGQMATGALAIPPGAVVGLPIFLFMFIVAVSQPGLGAWSERRGRRPAFLFAAALAVAAHLLSAQAASLAGLLAWRAAAGLAWAGAFVAAQGMVLAYTDQSSRAKGLAGFVAVVLVSLACGPALGGLLADALGYRATFLLAALLAAAALLLAWRTLPRAAPAPGVATARPAGVGALPLHPLRNWRFLGLLLLAAVPAKLILVAFCYYLMPLYLAAAGYSAAMAGRVIMVYSVVMVLLLPLGADAFERLRRRRRITPHAWFVGAGVACSGLAGGAMLLPSEIMAATVLAGVLGAAQALSISAQAAMVPQLARREIARHGEAVVYGYYRLVERIGSALGPLVAGAMLQLLGFRLSFLALGGVVFACGLLFALLFARPSQLTAAPAPAVAP